MHAAQVHKLAILQHPQDFGLRIQTHGPDFVKEQRASVGNFKQALLGGDSTGKRALDVAEERGLEQVRRHGSGVDRDESPVAARRIQMQRLGD